jgi:hypothetical protein
MQLKVLISLLETGDIEHVVDETREPSRLSGDTQVVLCALGL